MEWLKKYLLVLYVLITLLLIYTRSPLLGRETMVNIALLGLGMLFSFLFAATFYSSRMVRVFPILIGMLMLNIFYQLLVGWRFENRYDWLYMFAKWGVTAIIALSILSAPKFYFSKFYFYLCSLLAGMFLLGTFFNDVDKAVGRLAFGFGNVNAVGPLAAITFCYFLMNKEVVKWLRWGSMLISFVVIMAAGSRLGMILFILSFLFAYKISFRLIFAGVVSLLVVQYILPELGYNATGLDRLMNTYDTETKTINTARDANFELGWRMFINKFWTGYGLSAYRIIDDNMRTVDMLDATIHGTHNGYICAAKTYGVVFWIGFLSIIVGGVLYLFKSLFKVKNTEVQFHLYVSVSVLIAAMGEDYLIGVNSILTTLFFISSSLLGYLLYFNKNKPMTYVGAKT